MGDPSSAVLLLQKLRKGTQIPQELSLWGGWRQGEGGELDTALSVTNVRTYGRREGWVPIV